MTGVSIVLPSYKEAENLKVLLPEINEILKPSEINYEILIVDTIEPMDDTKSVCDTYGAVYVTRQGGNMYGDAIRTGIQKAAYDYILVMDADSSHNPKDIPRLYGEITHSGADIVIGSRYMKGGDTDNPWILKLMSHMVNIAYRVIFHLRVKDVSNSFRIYNAVRLKSITIECDNFDLVEEILIRMQIKYADLKIKEIPIFFRERMYGESKRELFKFALSYFVTIHRLYKMGLSERRKK